MQPKSQPGIAMSEVTCVQGGQPWGRLAGTMGPCGTSARPQRPLTCGLEDAGVAQAVAGGECLHHAVDFLSLPGKPEAPQELSGGEQRAGDGGEPQRSQPRVLAHEGRQERLCGCHEATPLSLSCPEAPALGSAWG